MFEKTSFFFLFFEFPRKASQDTIKGVVLLMLLVLLVLFVLFVMLFVLTLLMFVVVCIYNIIYIYVDFEVDVDDSEK